MVSKTVLKSTESKKAKYEGYSKGIHWLSVENLKNGHKHSVAVKVHCGCRFMSVQGSSNGKICSHIAEALKELINNEEV